MSQEAFVWVLDLAGMEGGAWQERKVPSPISKGWLLYFSWRWLGTLGIQALTWKPLEQSARNVSLGMVAIRLHSLELSLGQLKLPAFWGARDSDPFVTTLCSYTRVQASDEPPKLLWSSVQPKSLWLALSSPCFKGEKISVAFVQVNTSQRCL